MFTKLTEFSPCNEYIFFLLDEQKKKKGKKRRNSFKQQRNRDTKIHIWFCRLSRSLNSLQGAE